MSNKCENCDEKCQQAELARNAALGRMYATNEFIDLLKKVESGQFVEVVHCRECKYAKNAKWNKKGYRICPASHMEITDDDFCSYGVRKEEVLSCELET